MILITAFEPFGDDTFNTSAEVLRFLPARIHRSEIMKLLLPVVFGKAAEIVLQHRADCIFLLGEAGGRAEVTPELRAKNIRNARIPDNEGNQPRNEVILREGPDEYRTALPIINIVDRMRSEAYRIAVSDDAGEFVCNDTFYLVGVHTEIPVEFIHVPHRAEGVDELARTIERFIELTDVKKLSHP